MDYYGLLYTSFSKKANSKCENLTFTFPKKQVKIYTVIKKKGDSMILLGNDWDEILSDTLSGERMQRTMERAEESYRQDTVFPPREMLFRAFALTPFAAVRVVILGQDPYHGPGQANGLAFSVPRGVRIPPSLRNIYKELEADCGIRPAAHGDLTAWAERGVLLLNGVLTVRAGAANSHRGIGWEVLTGAVLDALNRRPEPAAFLLWGAGARSWRQRIAAPRHLVLEAAHPSPLSAHNGFFGCRHFSKAARFCAEHGEALDWTLPE